jgi:hypothetical protein
MLSNRFNFFKLFRNGHLVLSIIFLLGINPAVASSNHRDGLYLQLPNAVVDIGAADIEELQVFSVDKTHAAAMFKLKQPIADRLSQTTKDAIGEMAVWIWNGRVLSIETLKTPIGKDLAVHHLTQFEADDLKKKFQGKNESN